MTLSAGTLKLYAIAIGAGALMGVAAWVFSGAQAQAGADGERIVGESTRGRFTMCWRRGGPDCVVDGDTIDVDGQRVQIADIDAPEIYRADCARQAELGRNTAARLIQLLNSGPFEMAQYDGRDEDRYGRKLRVLMRGGKSLGGILVAEGLAEPWAGARVNWCG